MSLSRGSASRSMSARLFLKIGVSAALLGLLFARVDVATLWATARRASRPWLAAALGVYFLTVLASTWRWRLLLTAQRVHLRKRFLLGSYLVAGFFNNFLPSNIGGDVVRVTDTARSFQSKTRATTVILVDRAIGLIGLVLVAACGATIAAAARREDALPIWPPWLWGAFIVAFTAVAPAVLAPERIGHLLRPLAVLSPQWVGERIVTLTETLTGFRQHPTALVLCFTGAIAVQLLLVAYYSTVATALELNVTIWDLAVIVPVTFLVQMVPVSLNGFGVREAAFSYYFTRIGLSIESALLLSLVGAALMLAFSLTGAIVYIARGRSQSSISPRADATGIRSMVD